MCYTSEHLMVEPKSIQINFIKKSDNVRNHQSTIALFCNSHFCL